MVEPEIFANIIGSATMYGSTEKCFVKVGEGEQAYWEVPKFGAKLFHVCADPGDEEALKTVMSPREPHWKKYEVVIVLATSAKDIPKPSQDVRMLSTYILVHQLHKELNAEDY